MRASENGEAETEPQSSGGIFHRPFLFPPPRPSTPLLSLLPCSSAPGSLHGHPEWKSHRCFRPTASVWSLSSAWWMFSSSPATNTRWSTVSEPLKPLHAFVALSPPLCPSHIVFYQVLGHSVVTILLLLIYFGYMTVLWQQMPYDLV